jgi:hypothetical protein
MVTFLSNHCPDSHAAEGRIKKLAKSMEPANFAIVAINPNNPNNPDGLSIDELGYSKYNDGFEDMKKYAAEEGFTFPYLYDGETQSIAKSYGCLATPHVFIFDAARKLRYKGQFDDSRFADESTVKSQDARIAVEALLDGKPVPVEITKPHGCSTKWLSEPAPAQPEPTPFQRFDTLMRRIVSVPKAEIDRRAVEAKKARQEKRTKPAR